MTKNGVSRRTAMKTAAIGALGASAAPLYSTVANAAPKLDLEDPVVRAHVRAKISGSTVPATTHGLSQLHIYGYLNDGNVKPFMTLWNYTVTKWAPVSDTQFSMSHYESGIYTQFNSEKVLKVWENPVTGEQREVWPFLSGPITGVLGPDGLETGAEATVKPKGMGIHIIGDQVYLPSQSSFNFPNPFSSETWPKESAGPTYFWDSFSTKSALYSHVADPKMTSVPSSHQFQNLVSWHPWLGLGGVEGRTFGQAYGNKLMGGFNDLPEFLKVAVKKQTPEMLETDSWTTFRNDFADYMKARKPT
ncbi:MAG: DUF1838 family protein [Lysobacterales bacterium]